MAENENCRLAGGLQPKRKQRGLLREEAFHAALLNIHSLKHQINQVRLLHATDIAEEISSFGGAINTSLQQLCTELSLGRLNSLYIAGLSDLSIFITRDAETALCSAQPEPHAG